MFAAVTRTQAVTCSTLRSRGLTWQRFGAANGHVRAPCAAAAAPVQQRRKQSTLPAGFREDQSKGPMLRFEDSLPKLPIPTLEETAEKYLKSLRPLLTETEYARSAKAVDAFLAPNSLAHELQKRLLARREDPQIRNWLTEWWNHAAYLGYRAPVVPYVSYFYSHRDDRKRRDPAKRAAAISTAVLEFKKQVDEGTLEPEYMKKLPMAMSSYEYMFNCCRIPAEGADYPKRFPAKGNEHIVVARKNGFYKVQHTVGGQQLSSKELEHQFTRIYQIASKQPAVGALTTEDRDAWTSMRDRLLKTSPANKTALETIESASFLVCLDDAAPVTLVERSKQYWHGDGTNRFFDKPLQFIINENGTSGFTGEHSMMDGTPTHRLNDTVMNWIFNSKLDFESPGEVRSEIPDPVSLKFVLDEANQRDIAKAVADHVGVLAQHELKVEAYQGYGKGLMKKLRCSPDAYVQMVIQLAYHKFYGKSRPTYESAATRKFQEGRTETCRTVSEESVAFCEGMADASVSADVCRELLRRALEAHVKYITDAGEGKGCDRHLFGLKKLIRNGEEVPELFTDPAYAYSSSWYVSSSQLSSEYYNGYGWSQVIDEGWGIAYMINENSIQFNIVCKNLGAERMAFYLNEAAGEMRELMLPILEGGAKL